VHESKASGERGQILLISALLLAALFVGLAVVVNSAIYTENRATREVTRSSQPLADHPVTADRLGQALHVANFHSDTDDYDERHAVVGGNVSGWSSEMQGQAVQNGVLWGSAVAATTNGTRVSQDQEGTFMPAKSSLLDEVTTLVLPTFRIDPLGLGDKKNWVIANGTAVRDFRMNVTRSSLEERNPGLVTVLVDVVDTTLTGSTVFWAESDVTDGDGDFWRLYLLEDGTNVTAFVVEFDGGAGTVRAECSARGEHVDVLVSEGKLVGEDGPVACPATRNLSGQPSRDLYYAGADEVEGTYGFIVDKEESTFRSELADRYGTFLDSVVDALVDLLLALIGGSLEDDDIYHESPSDGHPYTTTAIYNTTVELSYEDERVRYSRNVTVPAES
jgi:hypothetical protein